MMRTHSIAARLAPAALLFLQAMFVFGAPVTFTDANWISMGVLPGTDREVRAAVADDSGNVYIAGDFSVVGEAQAWHIAKWDGTNWSRLFWSPNDRVFALAVSGRDLYAGGEFTSAGTNRVNRIAKWDGTNWSALGSGMDDIVSGLAVSGTDVYAAGLFTTAGGSPANRIARWNGTSWSALGSGFSGPNSYVSALAVLGSDLYVGGSFTNAGGIPANRIAKWDGTSWSALGSGISLYSGPGFPPLPGFPAQDSHVSALAVSGSDLYTGGTFTNAGGSPAANIAKWDGTTWSPLAPGLSVQFTN